MANCEFEIFVDGGCSMCSREARLMLRLDRGRGRLRVTNLTDLDFESNDLGITYDDAMRSIHGRAPGQPVIEGVEVFRRAYEALGCGWLWAPTRWPLIRPCADLAYKCFAKWRYRRRMRQQCGLPNANAG